MKIALGSDHAGYAAKEKLAAHLRRKGHSVWDAGTSSEASVDYPDYARAVGGRVARGAARRGVLVCGTGIGMCISANKVRGVRAAVVWSVATARLAAEHNDANVLCLSGRLFDHRQRAAMLDAWLAAPFAGGRHARRVRKIRALERGR
jgi:RpiB/LacA/LacB family sugar-phosphate isomerase